MALKYYALAKLLTEEVYHRNDYKCTNVMFMQFKNK